MKIVLASTSKYRVAQLNDFGLEFTAHAPTFDEEAHKAKKISPRALSRFLAFKKAESLVEKFPNAVILGADQLVNFQGRVLGKPHTVANAERMLKAMSGRTHQLITSLCVLHHGRRSYATVTANITLRKLTAAEIKSYVKLDQPLDCAGSYKFERAGLSLVKTLRVSDPSSLTGLSLLSLMRLLLEIQGKTGEKIPFRLK